jgi:hypothetical protein
VGAAYDRDAGTGVAARVRCLYNRPAQLAVATTTRRTSAATAVAWARCTHRGRATARAVHTRQRQRQRGRRPLSMAVSHIPSFTREGERDRDQRMFADTLTQEREREGGRGQPMCVAGWGGLCAHVTDMTGICTDRPSRVCTSAPARAYPVHCGYAVCMRVCARDSVTHIAAMMIRAVVGRGGPWRVAACVRHLATEAPTSPAPSAPVPLPAATVPVPAPAPATEEAAGTASLSPPPPFSSFVAPNLPAVSHVSLSLSHTHTHFLSLDSFIQRPWRRRVLSGGVCAKQRRPRPPTVPSPSLALYVGLCGCVRAVGSLM